MINPYNNLPLHETEGGYKDDSGAFFPKKEGVVRFVQDDNYTGSFGFQWNKFEKTQIDNPKTKLTVSRDRFFAATGWDKVSLKGMDVLEVGSGAGRFSQVVLDYTEANLYSLDYSDAVSANYRNNQDHGDRFKLFQASIYDMPFPDNSFDKVFCFGVLQHTPDFKKSVKALIDKAKPGGEVILDFYPILGWYSTINVKYMLRPFTKKMSHEKLLSKIEKNVDSLMKWHFFFHKIGIGKLANRFLPVVDITRTIPLTLSKQQLRETVILDTFDMFSPAHDHPQRIKHVAKWCEDFNLDVTHAGLIQYGDKFRVAVVKGIKKA